MVAEELCANATPGPCRVLELFAGIGGMRVALGLSGLHARIVAAYEVSEVCERAYHHNFPPEERREWRRATIERISCEDVDSLEADVWLMSPPCQPFTRSGRKLDVEDTRTKALLHLIELIPRLTHPPQRILLENVIGFERSESRCRLLRALDALGWEVAELDLRPEDFGIPNSRPRYYGLFRSGGIAEGAAETDSIEQHIMWRPASEVLNEASPTLRRVAPNDAGRDSCQALGHFMQSLEEVEQEEARLGCSLEIPQETFAAFVASDGRYDLHLRTEATSACLTKNYGRFPRGYGPLVFVNHEDEAGTERRPKLGAQGAVDSEASYNVWREGARVRYLTPTEQLRLMGYPEWFSFPDKMAFRDCCSLVGNSLNVAIVAWLLPRLLGVRDLPPAPMAPPITLGP